MTVSGEGPWVRRDASGGSGAWRGLSLAMTATQNIPATESAAIAFDVLLADSDGIRSTSDQGPFSGAPPDLMVPAGSCGVVPAGMGGLWRLSGNCDVYPSNGGQFFAFGIVINDFSALWEDDLAGLGVWAPPTDFNLTIAPFVYPLSDGDVVWCNFANTEAGASDVGGSDATFLMEYLGPAPAAS